MPFRWISPEAKKVCHGCRQWCSISRSWHTQDPNGEGFGLTYSAPAPSSSLSYLDEGIGAHAIGNQDTAGSHVVQGHLIVLLLGVVGVGGVL